MDFMGNAGFFKKSGCTLRPDGPPQPVNSSLSPVQLERMMSKFPAHDIQESKDGWSTGTKILVGILGLVAIVAVLAVVTLTVAVIESETGTSFPYSSSYRVSLPDGELVTIGNTKIIVLVIGDSVDTSVDGTKETLAVGQDRVISPHFARISALGIPLIDTDFQITLKYLGSSGNNALFDMTVRTSQQIPELILRRLIPSNMHAQPI